MAVPLETGFVAALFISPFTRHFNLDRSSWSPFKEEYFGQIVVHPRVLWLERKPGLERMIAVVRALELRDSIAAITDLLHRAYAPLRAMGLNYTGVDQTSAETARRIGRGECAVAVIGEQLVGTILAVRGRPDGGCAWYRESHVARAHQFAVEPTLRRNGIGGLLMHWVEAWAREHGYGELALDTAEPAEHLIAFYSRRGFRFIEFAQWPGKRYRSVILSKSLSNVG